MNAIIVAVGSELLTPARMDTDSLYLTGKLNAIGIEVALKLVVGDDRDRLTHTLRTALEQAPLVIVTGGLGPTEDDLTRECAAAALGRGLTFDDGARAEIAAFFERMNRAMAEINLRQAYLIDGAELLPNPNGTAPGQWIDAGSRWLVLLPGPPRELQPMFENHVLARLVQVAPPSIIRTRILRVTGIGESDLDQLIAPVYTRYANPVTTVLAAPGDVQVHFRATGETAEQAEALLAELSGQVEPLLGDRIYSTVNQSLEETVGSLLRRQGATVAVAESCTAGLLAERLTEPPGASAYFLGGFLTYTDRIKTELLGVDPALLAGHGAVSEPVARAMAELARERTGATWGVSVTGIAGPDGGTEATPVGTVFVGLASSKESTVRHLRFPRDRAFVRWMASQTALDLLRRGLLRT